MLKYVDAIVTFSEFPDEISLCINISSCQVRCKGCHSSYLWQDKGEFLNIKTLDKLIQDNLGITCVGFLGEGNSPFYINTLAQFIKRKYPALKVGYYTGYDELSKEIDLHNFDYIKIGHFNGIPINKEGTNQKMYRIIHKDGYILQTFIDMKGCKI